MVCKERLVFEVIIVGMNGFGRFGMHLLRYWMINYARTNFSIDYINDEHLSLEKIADIIASDPYLDLKDSVRVKNSSLLVKVANRTHTIAYTNLPITEVSWLGKPIIFLECSGKHADIKNWEFVVHHSTKHVVISASSEQATKTLVYGYNHTEELDKRDVVLSYGSCTINAFIPLANYINRKFVVSEADVNIIHNIPHYKRATFNTLQRASCTLEKAAPRLLSFITETNFKVNYTYVPYDGVSLIDYRFRITNRCSVHDILAHIRWEIEKGDLCGIYGIEQTDNGPEYHKFTPYSAVLIENTISLVGNNLYIQAYFDNENSANRYFDIVNYLCEKL